MISRIPLLCYLLLSCGVLFCQPNNLCFNGVSNVGSPTVNTTPRSVCAGDFDNDGDIDFATANELTNRLVILRGYGTGTFNVLVTYTNVTYDLASIECGDFNGDGNLDLITANRNTSNVALLLGGGSGYFGSPTYFNAGATSSGPSCVIVKDFNLDGNLDLAVTNSYTSNISILLGTGTGSFSPYVTYVVGTAPSAIVSKDLNNDTFLDLAVTNNVTNDLSILLGSGTGTFAAAQNFSVGTNPSNLWSADVNNDGNADLVTTNFGSNDLTLLLGQGNGSFVVSTLPGSFSQASAVQLRDLNGDGNQDLVVTSHYRGIVSVLQGNGNGTFQNPNRYTAGMEPLDFFIGDVSSDNRLDIVTVNHSSHDATILLGLGNCRFSGAQSYSVNGNPYSVTTGDYNNDGNVDFIVGAMAMTSVFLGNGNGLFSGTNYTTYLGSTQSADFNLDGNLDLVSPVFGGVGILFGLGNGTFSTPVTYSVAGCTRITCGDFNNDNNMDVGFTNYSGSVNIMLGSPSGTFSILPSYTIASAPHSICKGDFNGDGNLDLAVGTNSMNSNSFWVYSGQGNGLFSGPTNFSVGIAQQGVCSGNFNNDAYSDLAVIGGYSLFMFLGSPSGLVASATYAEPEGPLDVQIGDFNADGNTDLAFANWTSDQLTVRQGNGSGFFSIEKKYRGNSGQTNLATNDFNSDGRSDIVAISQQNDAVVLMSGSILLSATSNSICNGGSVTLVGSGAISYSWSTGAITSSIIVTPTVTTNYSVSGLAASGCNYSSVKTVSVNVLPTLTVSPSSSVCIGTSANLTVSTANTFTWSNNSTFTLINVQPTLSTTYSVTASTSVGCVATQTVAVNVNPNCQDVWPGDANSDGVANNLDILEMGLHFNSTGPPRNPISNSWTGYFANNWVGTITNGKNKNHSDCNGDGVIDLNDTLAVFNNYNLVHNFKEQQQTNINSEVSIVADQVSVNGGEWGTSSIYLGEQGSPILNLNGLALSINYNNALIEQDSIWLDFLPSFFNVSGNNMDLGKRFFVNGVLYVASTHTNNVNVSGFGKIGVLHYKIQNNIPSATDLIIKLTQVIKSDNTGNLMFLTSGEDTVQLLPPSVGINSFAMNNSAMSIYPNPVKDELSIKAANTISEACIYSSSGQELFCAPVNDVKTKLSLKTLANGMYTLKIIYKDQSSTVRKIVIQK